MVTNVSGPDVQCIALQVTPGVAEPEGVRHLYPFRTSCSQRRVLLRIVDKSHAMSTTRISAAQKMGQNTLLQLNSSSTPVGFLIVLSDGRSGW